MANIILVTRKNSSEQIKHSAKSLAAQYEDCGHSVTVLSDAPIFLFVRLLFSNANIIDFHDSLSSLVIPLIKLLKRKTTIIFSLHERAEFNPKNNFLRRAFIRLGTYLGILYAHQIVTSQKNIQYFIYRRFSLLPNYIPQGVDAVIPFQKRKYASHFLTISEQKDCSRILRTLTLSPIWSRMFC